MHCLKISQAWVLQYLTQIMEPYYLEQLKKTFEEKRKKNAKYSTRALARDLKIDPGLLSSILRQKRIPSKKVAESLAESMKFNEIVCWTFLRSIEEQRRLDKELKASRLKRVEQHTVAKVTQEQFEKVSKWYHPAIMTLTQIEGFSEKPEFIAKRLGITEVEAAHALEDLIDADILFRNSEGKLVAREQITVVDKRECTTNTLKNHQKELLDQSKQSVDRVPYGKRFHMGTAIAIDPEKLPEARKIMEEFMRSLSVFLESGKKQNVYQFSTALFPLEVQKND